MSESLPVTNRFQLGSISHAAAGNHLKPLLPPFLGMDRKNVRLDKSGGDAIDSSKFPPGTDNSSDGTVPDLDPIVEPKKIDRAVDEPPSYALPSQTNQHHLNPQPSTQISKSN